MKKITLRVNSDALWLLWTRTVTGLCSSQLILASPCQTPGSGALQPCCNRTPCRADSAVPVICHPKYYHLPTLWVFNRLGSCCSPFREAALHNHSLTANVCVFTDGEYCVRVLGAWMTATCIDFSPQHPGRGVGIVFPNSYLKWQILTGALHPATACSLPSRKASVQARHSPACPLHLTPPLRP